MDRLLRQLRRQWGLGLATLLCLVLASALVAALVGYTDVVVEQELQQNLARTESASRQVYISGARTAFGADLDELLEEKLGAVLGEKLVIRRSQSPLGPRDAIGPTQQGTDRSWEMLDLYSLDRLPDLVRVLEGRLPQQIRLREATQSWRPPPIEAAIGPDLARVVGLGLGDRLTGRDGYHRLDIVGVIEPLNPEADVWGGDLDAFGLSSSQPSDLDALPLIIADSSMRSHYPEPPIFPHQISWRLVLMPGELSASRAAETRVALINVRTQSTALGARVSTGLVDMLTGYLARISRAQTVFVLLAAQSVAVVLLTLTLFASITTSRSSAEIATRAARGGSVGQLVMPFALMNLFLALAAWLLGMALAEGALWLWGKSQEVAPLLHLSLASWLLPGLVAGLGWLALTLPIYLAAQGAVRGTTRRHVPHGPLAFLQGHHLDLYLLVLSALLYWQLGRTGSLLARVVTGNGQEGAVWADPLLLVSPTLLLLALALVLLRIWPPFMRLAALLSIRGRGWVWPLGLLRMGRHPHPGSSVALLVSLTAGLALFSQLFRKMWSTGGTAVPETLSGGLGLGISNVLQLNTIALVLYSVVAFFLAYLMTASARISGSSAENGILRAMGMPVGPWLVLVGLEGGLTVAAGLLGGFLVGLGLVYTMVPYLLEALGVDSPSLNATDLWVHWPTVLLPSILLTAIYGGMLLVLLVALAQTTKRRIPHQPEE
jgi:hypothetical protein